ncbi:MAG: (2Fe-2S) ferredoxin domain-containing protein [Leptolyngbya sp. SIO1E4]|nr:(2Fe-2S) ferredoxin domain-containing protein [Leptolyngbya sp. SIO1E4]
MEQANGVTASPHPENSHIQPKRQIRICQNVTCKHSGALAVLHEFQALTLSDVEIVPVTCLGRCGNGPMVLVLPDHVWYCHVNPQDVRTISTQHLIAGDPVTELLDPALHPAGGDRSRVWAYIFLLSALLVTLGTLVWAFLTLT